MVAGALVPSCRRGAVALPRRSDGRPGGSPPKTMARRVGQPVVRDIRDPAHESLRVARATTPGEVERRAEAVDEPTPPAKRRWVMTRRIAVMPLRAAQGLDEGER